MSRLTDLIAQTKAKDPQLGADLDREFKVLSSRLPFGLNFERHRPEVVELPQRPVRKGDKVRVLSERLRPIFVGDTVRIQPVQGAEKKKTDKRLWRVEKLTKTGGGEFAQLRLVDDAQEPIQKVAVDELLKVVPKSDQRLWQVRTIRKAIKQADLELLGATVSETQTISLDDLVVVAEFRDTIYPGLVSTGKVQRGGDKPNHTVINGENYHVLRALTYTHRGKVDAIYIDPPYNSGARDWKYNNDYVEKEDLYRHSKWLAFMERRLLVAKELLNPADSVLIVTIDEKEYLRLGLLLEQAFPEAAIEMVTTVVNPRGRHRPGRFARSDEYIYFVMLGQSKVGQEFDPEFVGGDQVPWRTLRRSDAASARGKPKGGTGQFYPIYVTPDGLIEEIGDPLPHGVPRDSAPARAGCIAVFPIRDTGLEMNWGLTQPTLRDIKKKGYVRVGRHNPNDPQEWEISYLTSGKIEDIEGGRATVVGRNKDGSVIAEYVSDKLKTPTSTWMRPSHNAETGGTNLLKAFLPDRRFPFPKSLYAVEDTLRFFVSDKPDALIVDFFSGSGTTAHAVMRLNHQDGGRRQCIAVTNNEVAASEHEVLSRKGLRPGDAAWESFGICDHITKPRVLAAITGKTPDGGAVEGDYSFIDEFPMADGFDENAEFFTLTYETPVSVSHNTAFARIAPLLWLRAGSRGKRIDRLPPDGWEAVDAYGLLTDVDSSTPFVKAVTKAIGLRMVYIVTDDDRRFQAIARRLPEGVEPVRLYESYLTNFSFASGE